MESGQSFNFKRFIITFACGFAGSLAVGLLVYQGHIFRITENRFIYTSLGFAGAIVFSVMLYRGIKDSILAMFAVYLLNLVVCKSFFISYIIRDIAVFGSFWLCIYLYYNWLYNSTGKYKDLRTLGLGIISAIILFITGLFLLFINVPLEKISIDTFYMVSVFYLMAGFLIGLGLGLGFDLSEYLINKNIFGI